MSGIAILSIRANMEVRANWDMMGRMHGVSTGMIRIEGHVDLKEMPSLDISNPFCEIKCRELAVKVAIDGVECVVGLDINDEEVVRHRATFVHYAPYEYLELEKLVNYIGNGWPATLEKA